MPKHGLLRWQRMMLIQLKAPNSSRKDVPGAKAGALCSLPCGQKSARPRRRKNVRLYRNFELAAQLGKSQKILITLARTQIEDSTI